MPIPWIAIGISIAISGLLTALNYMMRSKIKTPNSSADDPTYSGSMMQNITRPGYPVNTVYGKMEIAPAIINWFKRSKQGGEETDIYFLLSGGEGPINGVQYVKINGSKLQNYYGGQSDFDIYISHGEQEPIIYKWHLPRKATITAVDINAGTINYTLANAGKTLSAANHAEMGYIYVVGKGMVRYTGNGTNQLTGCRFPEIAEVEVDDVMKQYYAVYRKDGVAQTQIPHFNKNILSTTTLDEIVPGGEYSTVYETENKIHAFFVTLALRGGCYRFDDKDGYLPSNVDVNIQWRKRGEAWNDSFTTVTEVRDSTATDGDIIGSTHTLRLKQNKKYCYLGDNTGAVLKGTLENLQDKIVFGDFNWKKEHYLEFTAKDETGTSTAFRYRIKNIEYEDTGEIEEVAIEGEAYRNGRQYTEYQIVYKIKINFKKQVLPNTDDKAKFPGADQNGISYQITRDKEVADNIVKYSLPEQEAVKLSDFEATYYLPLDEDDFGEPLDYDYYDIRVKKRTEDITDAQKGQNELTLVSIQECTTDRLIHPNEALIGVKARMNERINGSIDQVTAMVEGLLIKDVQDDQSSKIVWEADTTYSLGNIRRPTAANGYAYRVVAVTGDAKSGGAEPTWPKLARARVTDNNVTWEEDVCRWSDNPIDVKADIALNQRYGRGVWLELSQAEETDFYSRLSDDAAYCDNSITENDPITSDPVTRKRFSINYNFGTRDKIVNQTQILSKCVRAYDWWDGVRPMMFIDRYRAPAAMYNNANINKGTIAIETLDDDDKINRMYGQFLNKNKKYIQDQVGRDWNDQGFEIENLNDTELAFYPLTEDWYVHKVMDYLLKYSYYVKHLLMFESLEAALIDPGEIFYYSDQESSTFACQTGRIFAVGTNSIILDRAFTFLAGQTYKALLRQDDGTPVEYTVDLAITGTGAQTLVVFTGAISSISVNSIYSLGKTSGGNEYYRKFICIHKEFSGDTVKLVALTYDINVFAGLYENDPVVEEQGTTAPGLDVPTDVESLDRGSKPPQNVKSLVVKEDPRSPGTLVIGISKPISATWSYANIYAVDELDNKFYIGRTSGEILTQSGFKLGATYTIIAESYTSQGVAAGNAVSVEITLDGTNTLMLPPTVSGMRVLYKPGTETEVAGEDFEIEWDPVSTFGDDSANQSVSMAKQGYDENIRYLVEWYYSEISSSIKLNNKKVNEMVAYSEEVYDPRAKFTLKQNIESVKTIFEKYPTHSSYSAYYGVPQRTVKAKVYTVDAYGKMSTSAKEVILTNPKPQMLDSSGNLLPLNLEALKSGARVEFSHPHQEYDIKYFVRKHFKAAEWIASTIYQRYDIIYDPTTNEIFYCYNTSGTSSTSKPNFALYGGSYGVFPSTGSLINDGTVKWDKLSSTKVFEVAQAYTIKYADGTRVNLSDILVSKSIPSMVGIANTDTEIAGTKYTQDEYVLDTKYYYFFGVIAIDPFGRDTSQFYNYAYGGIKPGSTDDDTEAKIESPGIPNLSGISEPLANSPEIMYDGSTLNRLRMTWKNEDEGENEYTDIDYFVIQFFGIAKPDADLGDFPSTESAIGNAIDNGYVTIDALNYIFTLDEITKDQQSGSKTRAYLSGAISGTTYYARVKAVNTSGLSSGWTTITADTMEAIEGDITGVVMSSLTGETTSPTIITVTELSEYIKIEVDISDAPEDLWGAKFAVKSNAAFTYAANTASGISERNALKTAEIAAKEGKITYYFNGATGNDYYISAMPLDNSKNSAKYNGVASWLDADSNPYQVQGISHESLGTSFKKYKFSGTIAASDYNTVTWTMGILKIKGQSGSPFTINYGTTYNFTGTKVIFWVDSNPTNFSIADYDDFYTDSAYDNALALAWVEANSDTSQKATVIPMSGDDFSITASMISSNAVATSHLQAGSVTVTKISVSSLSAISANFGTATFTGQIRMSDGTDIRILLDGDSNPPRLIITKPGIDAVSDSWTVNDLLFSTIDENDNPLSTFKILDSGIQTVIIPAYSVATGSYNSAGTLIKNVASLGTLEKGVIGFANIGGGYGRYKRQLPIRSGFGNANNFTVSLGYSANDGAIYCESEAWATNNTKFNVSSITFRLKWYLLGDIIT
ncbi:MAG: hypothetical protein E3K37_01260 [Candidatus Kuenenia sp.]|nr:hypothetical protein [Candidatus Kuenenia hertensis]